MTFPVILMVGSCSLTYVLFFLPGYPQGYPTAATAPPPPPLAAVPPRFIRQALPPATVVQTQVANGSYCAAPPTIDTRSLVVAPSRDFRQSFHHGTTTFRNPNSGFGKSGYRFGFHRNGNSPGKGIKRKADEISGSPSPNSSLDGTTDVDGKADSTVSGESVQPLYCKVCRVTLNAPAQAKQHYEGKNHSKKMRLYEDTDEEKDKDKQGNTEVNGTGTDQVGQGHLFS